MKDNTIFDQFAKKGKGQKLRTDGKAVIYTRVSTKEQAENNASLETQLKNLPIKKDLKLVSILEELMSLPRAMSVRSFRKCLTM